MDRASASDLLQRLHAVQGAYYAGGDQEPLRALLTEDIEWHVPGNSAIAGHYYGLDEVFEYFSRRRDLAKGTLRMHPGELLVGDTQHVASLTDATAVIDGVEHRWSTVGLYRIRADTIAACWLLAFDQSQFDAIWSAA